MVSPAATVAAAVSGLLAGEVARRVVVAGRFRRDGDPQPARGRGWGWWAWPAGAGGGWVLWAALAHRSPAVAGAGLLAGAVLLLLALVDADVHRLPDVLTRPLAAGLLVVDALAALLLRDPGPLVAGVGGGAALFLGFCALALVGSGLGYGDVKLAGAVGIGLGPLGWGAVAAMPVIGFVLGGMAAVVLLATGRATRTTHLALGPALAAGAVLATVVV